jgi:hypothetical protein
MNSQQIQLDIGKCIYVVYMSIFFWLPWGTNQVPFHSGRFCVCPPQWIQVDRKTWQPTSFSLLCVSLILVPHVYLFYFAIFFCYVRFGHGQLLFRFRSLYSYFFNTDISQPGNMGSPCIAFVMTSDIGKSLIPF